MKKTLLLLIAIAYSSLIFSQNSDRIAYYDALFIKSVMDLNKPNFKDSLKFNNNDPDDKMDEILSFYFGDLKKGDLKTAMDNNPFLKDYYSSGDGASSQKQISLQGLNIPSFFSSFGSTNVTNFADGLAKFLVERSKEELNVAFFSKFQDFINEYPEVKVIFPTTADFIGQINSYQYSAMLPALKAGFQKDLNGFTSNLLNLRKLNATIDCGGTKSDCKDRLEKLAAFFKSKEGRAVIASLIVADNLVKGNDAATLITNVADDEIFTSYPAENLSNVVQFVALISNSIRSEEDGRVWITKKQINELIKDEVTFKIYLGLLYAKDVQSSNPISFKIEDKTVSLQEILTTLAENWDKYSGAFKTSFKTLANAASDVSENAKNIATAKSSGEQASILIYADYASSVATFLKGAVTFIESNKNSIPKLARLSQVDDTKKFISVIDQAVNACYDIKSQNYSALILHTSLILTDVLNDKDFPFKENYIKYGTFMANVVEAKNSDEVNAAIEAAVLPVGSSSIKRETDVNIALNAYIGGYAGAENMQSLETNKTAFSAGLTAPVGLAFSWGNKFKCDKDAKSGGKSITLFVPLIDVGVLASYRINDSNTTIASDIQLKNIVSPGLYVYYGFGKCPISVGLGAQLGTQLREVNEGVATIETDKLYFRYGITFVVDIPLLNFYTKNKD